LIAITAAALPWIFCFLYFLHISDIKTDDALLLARFAAPTSAGVLITLLAAAGLGATWVFRKARILAIFDDLDTIILLIPLRALVGGFTHKSLISLLILAVLLFLAYRYLHKLKIHIGRYAIFLYGTVIALISAALSRYAHMEVEVLLPAFCFGCILSAGDHHELAMTEREAEPLGFNFDLILKAIFMLLVGASIPRIAYETIEPRQMILQVTIITILSNLGKCFPLFCYRKEATLRERLALCISLFPRGEVGAGVLVLALSLGVDEQLATIAGLSLGVNLLLTGVFIATVKWLINGGIKKTA
jgi:Na+:H+ antiporter